MSMTSIAEVSKSMAHVVSFFIFENSDDEANEKEMKAENSNQE